MYLRRPRILKAGLFSAAILGAAVLAVWFGAGVRQRALVSAAEQSITARGRQTTATVTRRDFVRTIRLSGTVEAIQSTTISAPRLAGPNTMSLVITRLVRNGSAVRPGDLIVEFDRQQQLTNALDRRAELADLEQQIRKREAQEAAAAAKDDSEIKVADSSVTRAELEMVKNDLIPKIFAEKNTLALEQAEATLKQLKTTYELKRQAAEADLRILRIRRDRARNAMQMAESNADRMAIHSPIGGMAVVKSIWKMNNIAEVQEGEEIRAGVPVVDIVNPNAMRVRARVNQADINELRVGLSVEVGLDAYPDLQFRGRVAQVSPLGVMSNLTQKVRLFVVLVDVEGSHPNLMPDLTASLDVELSRTPGALVVPLDAVRQDGEHAFVRVQRGSGFEEREVTIGAVSAHEAAIASGVDDGVVVARNAARGTR
jgi:multidrug efflux pump subunit AcrA (membrane-fusion protein)